jgi:lipid-A-disaccharide synthase-like uncharacterized protein
MHQSWFHLVSLVCGTLGGVCFFGRFWVQWVVSERQKRYVVPTAFWYMSLAGSLLLFVYAFERVSPGGTLGLCFNVLVYHRNLAHIWREQGWLTPWRSRLVHACALVLMAGAMAFTLLTWKRGYTHAPEFWFWSAVWVLGQVFFVLRFAIQLLVTELRQTSVIPASFWRLSIAGAILHEAYYLSRGDWFLAVGTLGDLIPSFRNLILMRATPAPNEEG